MISLDAPDFKTRVTALSGAGRVPVLIDGAVQVWESLAILEYLAEKFPAAALWPKDADGRARARAIASEMHAGFTALRRQLPMNVARPVKRHPLDAAAAADVARIDAIWNECRAEFGAAWRISVWTIRCGRCHVCAGGLAFPHLRGRSQRRRARLYARGAGTAGLNRMARSGAARDLGAAARRNRLAAKCCATLSQFVLGQFAFSQAAFQVRATAAADR